MTSIHGLSRTIHAAACHEVTARAVRDGQDELILRLHARGHVPRIDVPHVQRAGLRPTGHAPPVRAVRQRPGLHGARLNARHELLVALLGRGRPLIAARIGAHIPEAHRAVHSVRGDDGILRVRRDGDDADVRRAQPRLARAGRREDPEVLIHAACAHAVRRRPGQRPDALLVRPVHARARRVLRHAAPCASTGLLRCQAMERNSGFKLLGPVRPGLWR
mmetsp:Transcript_42480/g.133168  ORF Transcript_42480/g.133168 Transcript_42480/m.133168 type:complete len:219 (+) Transcript_42480:124-780(+)